MQVQLFLSMHKHPGFPNRSKLWQLTEQQLAMYYVCKSPGNAHMFLQSTSCWFTYWSISTSFGVVVFSIHSVRALAVNLPV